MKVLLISADNIYLTPYISLYINLLEKKNINYKIIYWDKNENEKIDDPHYERFENETKNKFKTLFGYLMFRDKILKEMYSEEYQIIICLHQICNLIFWSKLTHKFKNKYIYDVRDYSYEKFKVVRWIEKQLVRNSRINIISSEGFKSFLPAGDYEIAHNIPKLDCEQYKQVIDNSKEVINICYIGLIRFMEQNKKIIDFFKNDDRFHLYFIGTNAEKLEGYCVENGVENVTLTGTFESEKTLEYYKDADLIMNLYGNKSPLLNYALSNKLYYAAILYKPILVCKDTYMEEVAVKNGFGFVVELKKEEEKDDLYKYIKTINREKLIKDCNAFMKKVYMQQEQLVEKLNDIFE